MLYLPWTDSLLAPTLPHIYSHLVRNHAYPQILTCISYDLEVKMNIFSPYHMNAAEQ